MLRSTVFSLGLFAQDDVVVIQFDGKEFPVKVGDNVEFGYGTNPYGSFMYVVTPSDHDVMVDKAQAGKVFEVKKIQTYPKRNEYWIRVKSGYEWGLFKVFIDNGRCQAIEVGEIVKVNDVETTPSGDSEIE